MRLSTSLYELEEKEEQLRQAVAALPEARRRAFYTQQASQMKDPDTYAVLNCFCLGGMHHLYLGQQRTFFIELAICLFAIFLFLADNASGWVLLVGLALYELPQLFYAQKRVRLYNYQRSLNILEDIRDNISSI